MQLRCSYDTQIIVTVKLDEIHSTEFDVLSLSVRQEILTRAFEGPPLGRRNLLYLSGSTSVPLLEVFRCCYALYTHHLLHIIEVW